MKYTFIRLAYNTADYTPPVCTVLAEADSGTTGPNLELEKQLDAGVERCVFDIINRGAPIEGQPASVARGGAPRGRPGQLVQVIAIDDSVNAPSGVAIGENYTTRELSTMLGFSYNAVVQGVSVARSSRTKAMASTKDPTERMNLSAYPPQATLRGVTFCYLNDINPETV